MITIDYISCISTSFSHCIWDDLFQYDHFAVIDKLRKEDEQKMWKKSQRKNHWLGTNYK